MNQKLTGKGGPGRGQGRKPSAISNAMKTVTVKVTELQREKLAKLGGGKWVRAKIDAAKLQPESPAPDKAGQ